jgi:5-methylcytosine-specific restriction endonuclease McrA
VNKLSQNTLVLNRSWMAVQICSVKRAISLLFQNHARVVDADGQTYTFDDWSEVSQEMIYTNEEFVSSPTLKIKIPRVIVLTLYDKLPKRHVSFTRKNIFERDHHQCQYCGVSGRDKGVTLNLEHVLPKCRGGKTTWENIVASCTKCNTKKGNRTLREVGWKLRKTPTMPKWSPTIQLSLRAKPHKEWVNFLDLAYWNTELENDNTESENKDESS